MQEIAQARAVIIGAAIGIVLGGLVAGRVNDYLRRRRVRRLIASGDAITASGLNAEFARVDAERP